MEPALCTKPEKPQVIEDIPVDVPYKPYSADKGVYSESSDGDKFTGVHEDVGIIYSSGEPATTLKSVLEWFRGC